MFCENCGTEYSDKQLFCEKCGAKLPVSHKSVFEENKPVQQSYVSAGNRVKYNNNNTLPKKSLSKPTVIVITELLILLGMLYFLVPYITHKFSAEHKAEQYFVALANGDYDKVYSLFNIDQNEEKNILLNKDGLKYYRDYQGVSNILNYKVNKNETDTSNKNDLRKEVEISFTDKESSGEHYFSVNLVKEADKKFFFFDNWRVDYANVTVSDIRVVTLKDAKLKIDGKEIPEKYEADEGSDENSTFIIPKLFIGRHKLEATKSGMDTLTVNTDILNGNDTISMENMLLSKESVDKLQELAVDNMKKIYTAAANGDSFDKIKEIFVADEESLSNIRQSYERMVNVFNSDSQIIKKFNISKVDTEINTDRAIVMKTFSYNVEYSKYYASWFSAPEWKDGENTGNQSSSTEFVNVGGKWFQTGLGCEEPYVSYY